MRPSVLTGMCALAAWFVVGAGGVAVAGGLPPAIVDCNAHSTLTRHYTPSELHVALLQMPPDIAQYTDCYDVIERQLLAETGAAKLTDRAGGGSGGSFLPTPVLIAIVVLALAAAGLGVIALRRRQPPSEPRS